MPVKTHPPNPHRGLERFPLLTDTDPGTDRCVMVWIPDSIEYLELLGTALRWLTNGFKYERDILKTGKVQADAFTRSFADHSLVPCGDYGDCSMLQFRQTDCLLEFSLDGTNWDTAYNGSDCIAAKLADGTLIGPDALNDAVLGGKTSGGQQQGPVEARPGTCVEFFVTLQGRDRWLCPVPISTDDEITIQGAYGGWQDGNILDPWRCADGHVFFAGVCGGAQVTESTDPDDSIYHMKLVGNIDTYWFDAFNTTTIIPAGHNNQNLFLQANDSDLSDNQGSVTFKVTVCTGGWNHVFDFTVDGQGWDDFGSCLGHTAAYDSGRGWVNNETGSDSRSNISITFTSTFIVAVEIHYRFSSGVHDSGAGTDLCSDNGTTIHFGFTDPIEGFHRHDIGAATDFLDALVAAGNSGAETLITKIVVYGRGSDPF